MSIAQMVSWGSMFYAFAIVLEPMRAEFGSSITGLTTAYSVGLFVMSLAAWPVGILIDRGHGKAVMTGGSVLAALGLALHAQVNSVPALIAVWTLIGVAMACTLYEPAFAVMIRGFPSSYRSRITILTLLGGLASTVFWPLTYVLVQQFGWRHALTALAALQLLICVPIHWFFVPSTHPSLDTASATTTPDPAAAGDGLGLLIRSPLLLFLTVSGGTQVWILGGVSAHLVGMFDAQQVSHQTTLAVVACIGPMQVTGRLLMLLSERRIAPQRMTDIVLWLPVVGLSVWALMMFLGAAQWIVLAFVAALLYGAGNGMLTIIKGTAVADLIGPSRVATLNGIAAVPSAFMRALGPLLTAAVWESSGSVVLALLSLVVVAAISAISFVAAQKRARSGAETALVR
jgi:Major Facilitator Superfamily